MKWFKAENGQVVPTELDKLTLSQLHQTAAIADCLGRLIPQEGVDYDVNVILRGKNETRVSMQIVALTDKGQWWKEYVGRMIHKYPPTTTYKADVLPDSPAAVNEEENNEHKKEGNQGDGQTELQTGHQAGAQVGDQGVGHDISVVQDGQGSPPPHPGSAEKL